MKFIIDPKIFEQFPGLSVGVVLARGIDNSGVSEEVASLLREQQERVKNSFKLDELSAEPRIKVWREAYRSFGVKKNKYRSSVENLYRMVLGGTDIRHINKLVDLYNVISLKHMLPVGGENIDKMQGDLQLSFAGEGEPEVKLLGDKDPKQPKVGEVFYKDDLGAICRRWNWREAERTKLEETTKNTVLVIEGLPPVTSEQVEQAASELADLVEKHCGGEIKSPVLSEASNELEI